MLHRLKDHAAFLQRLGLGHARVTLHMTRDFLLQFDSIAAATAAQQQLAALTMAADGVPLFGDIDNRGDSLFVTLTYPHEIGADAVMAGAPSDPLHLASHVVFVAIKNGMHRSQGYVWCRSDVARHAPAEGAHVKGLYDTVMRHFGAAPEPALGGVPAPMAASVGSMPFRVELDDGGGSVVRPACVR